MSQVIKAQTSLAEITRNEVSKYVGFADNAKLYSVFDEKQKIYAVMVVPNWPRQHPAEIVVLARIVENTIVIEEDTTDKPLVDALMANAGIPREQIILAYAGETIPTTENEA